MDRKVRVHTIIFTEACPLACRYCDLKNDPCFDNGSPCMTKEQIFYLIDEFDKKDDENKYISRLLFSGGEPLLYWDWIKEIIEKYQNRFQYAFNTSGYLFTPEIIEFLSHYQVNFVLSVDGDEKLTNYLRPVNAAKYKTGYFKQLKTILPDLLFYFPETPFRIIVNPRYVDLLHKMYLEADKLGFKYFSFILDFESRPNRKIPKEKTIIYWEEKYSKILEEQFNLILNDIIVGFSTGVNKPQVVEMNNVLSYLFNKTKFDPDLFPCQIFNNRSLTTLYGPEELEENCFVPHLFPSLDIAKRYLNEEYNKCNHKCAKDGECLAFEYCALNCCPQRSWARSFEFFDFDELECAVNKVCYYGALKLLSVSNDVCANSELYKRFISKFIKNQEGC